jgi:stage V sporulation protein SpoVS
MEINEIEIVNNIPTKHELPQCSFEKIEEIISSINEEDYPLEKIMDGVVKELKVSSQNNVHKTGAAIMKNIQEGKKVILSAIGAEAVNQMVKSVGRARTLVAGMGLDLMCKVGFKIVHKDGSPRTAIVLILVVS